MFSKILIANRGEIACRIIRSVQKMSIKTIAVYSEVDEDALFVEMADEGIALGGKTPRESYLDISKIIKAVQESGAEAVHPGYGFLSEKAKFAKALQDIGVELIGPNSYAIESMGDKLEARKIAQEAKVNIIPGTPDPIQTEAEARTWANHIGYPIMIKAAAGGGGKGMRIVRVEAQLIESLHSAQNEARTAFGDDRVFIEKYIENPRHIEIQILGDKFGNIIHLGERECSLQRRHQKVIEEAPSPFLTPELRSEMGAQAISLAKRVNYDSAGTVEFVMGADRKFYFLEMNTRLQVEHPVTEFITGIDLVEEMIRIAAGEKLKLTQKDIQINGHAMEARIYAEDPAREFLPSSGRLVYYKTPASSSDLRIDTGVEEGDEISTFYDPMIAKVIAHGTTREDTRKKLIKALDETYIRGIATNTTFLATLLNTPQVIEGQLNTHLIEELFPHGSKSEITTDLNKFLVAVVYIHSSAQGNLSECQNLAVQFEGEFYNVSPTPKGTHIEFIVNDFKGALSADWNPSEYLFKGTLNNHPLIMQVDYNPLEIKLTTNGQQGTFKVYLENVAKLLKRMPPKDKPDLSNRVLSPMPGLVVDLQVSVGQLIKIGQPVAIIEAMKMENIIRAEREGIIEAVFVQKGQNVNVDQELARIA